MWSKSWLMNNANERKWWVSFLNRVCNFCQMLCLICQQAEGYVTYTVGQAQRQYGSGDRNLGIMANRRRAGGAGFFILLRCSFLLLLLLFTAPVILEPSQRICVQQIKTVKHKRTQILEKCSREKKPVDKNERQPGLEHGEGRTIMSKSFINNSTDRSGRSDRQARVMWILREPLVRQKRPTFLYFPNLNSVISKLRLK